MSPDPSRPSPTASSPPPQALSSRPSFLPSTPATAPGALSALSAILLGHNAKRASSDSVGPSKAQASLLARRRGVAGADALELGADFGLPFPPSRYSAASRANVRSTISDAEIPPLDAAPRRTRTRTAEESDSDLPPSPVGLPGGWSWDAEGRTRHTRDGALLLPPPFLDEGSSRDSFEGLLGTRTARESSQRLRRQARQLARDRPPPPVFPHSLLATASKLVSALGPPGGLDSGKFYRSWKDDPNDEGLSGNAKKERRRLERAETSMKGFEVSERLVSKLAERLRRDQESAKEETTDEEELARKPSQARTSTIEAPAFRAATPMSLFAPPPGSGFDTPFDYLSPPLPALTPGFLFDSAASTLSSHSPATPFAPPKPKLGPFFTDAEPSPFPLTPPELPSVATEDDYFTIHRTRTKRRASKSTLPRDSGDSHALSPSITSLLDVPLITAFPSPVPKPATPSPPHPSPTPSRLLFALSSPISFAFRTLERRARSHADFLIWVAVGSAHPTIKGAGLDSVGGILGALMHLVGFLFFLVVHSSSLLLSTLITLRSIALFSHWTFLNLTGRTDLSLVAKEYLVLCRKEWDLVCEQDGVRLGFWSVGIGFLEMAAIQAMSKERWIAEGPGRLKLLNGEDEEDFGEEVGPGRSRRKLSLRRRESIGGERPGIGRRRTTRRWAEDDGEGDRLLVTGGGDLIVEGTILNDSFDPIAHLSPSPRKFELSDDLDDLPPIDLGDALPGFSFPPAPRTPSSPFYSFATPSSPPLRPVPDPRPLPTLLKTIKRHARLATASYGLHSYLIDPVMPFTPSGATLPHRIFAHLGGVQGPDNVLHVAIQKEYLGGPSAGELDESYEPQIYLLRDDVNLEVVCVVRGTQSLADIKTDLEASFDEVELPSLAPDGEPEVFLAHAGILAAARRLLNPELSPLFSKVKAALEENDGYALVLVGHSLGAAIASTAAFLLGEYITSPSTPTSQGHWIIRSSSGLPPGRPLRAITFAHPTTVDLRLAHRTALGVEPLVLSVSLGSDVVVRMGVPQVREVRRALGRLAKKRRRFLASKEVGQHGKSEVLSSWWRWKRLGGGEGAARSDEVRKIEESAWVWRREMDDPAEALPDESMMVPAGKALHLDRLPAGLEATRRAQVEAMLDEDDDGEEPQIWGLYEVRDPSFFSCPLLEADLVKSHLPRVYLDAIESL